VNVAASVSIKRLARESERDFYRVHCDGTGNGWCRCVAWWVPTWEGWGERTAEQNALLRKDLFKDGVHDGYLIYVGGRLAGWVQAWKRDAFPKLAAQFAVPADGEAWMIGCVLILEEFRRGGVASEALAQVVADLKARGARSIDAYPKRGAKEAGELWNGPESIYARLGFTVVRDDPKRPVLRLTL
jgi:GNAT superfamily N-acetyltransferase